MKKLLFVVLSLFLLHSVINAQSKKAQEMLQSIEGEYEIDDNGNVSFVKIVDVIDSSGDTLSKDEIYNRAYTYFTYNYVDGESVIQLEDKDGGIIVAKGIYPNVHADASLIIRKLDAYHILRIDIKEG